MTDQTYYHQCRGHKRPFFWKSKNKIEKCPCGKTMQRITKENYCNTLLKSEPDVQPIALGNFQYGS